MKIRTGKLRDEAQKIGELDSFRIFRISEMLSGQDMVQALHRHDFYFILLVSTGAGKTYKKNVRWAVFREMAEGGHQIGNDHCIILFFALRGDIPTFLDT